MGSHTEPYWSHTGETLRFESPSRAPPPSADPTPSRSSCLVGREDASGHPSQREWACEGSRLHASSSDQAPGRLWLGLGLP